MDHTHYIFGAISFLAGGFLGSYMKKKGELQAVREHVNDVLRKQVEMEQLVKLTWSRRSEVISSVYSKLRRAMKAWHTP